MRLVIAFVVTAMALPALGNEELAKQIDAVAPLVNAEDYDALGGPDTARTIVDGIGGRWFTLKNTVRNWTGTGAPDRASLARNIENTCSDDWENIVMQEASGPESFRVVQTGPDGEDNGTFEMRSVDDTGRTFTTHMDDDYILQIYGMENADVMRQDALLKDMHERMSEGVQIWLPTPDLMVNVSSAETEVWGRCPL